MKNRFAVRHKHHKSLRGTNPYRKRNHPLLRWGVLASSLVVLGVVLGKSKEPEQAANALQNSSADAAQTTEAYQTFSLDLSGDTEPTAVERSATAAPTSTEKASAPTTRTAYVTPPPTPASSAATATPAEPVNQTAEQTEPSLREEQVTVEKGDTLSAIFSRLDIPAAELIQMMDLGETVDPLRKIRPGEEIVFWFDGERLADLEVDLNARETLHIERESDEFTARIDQHTIERRVAFSAGRIQDSLYNAGLEAGMPVNIIMEMANIFSWEIDFIRNVREGDSFAVMYEELYKDGEKIGNGNILAANFINRGEEHKAARFELPDGRVDYFDPEGNSLRRAFNRYPVDVVRISSSFNPNRMHPILKTRRPHTGTDFAARTGTPIKTTGNGTITYRGWKGGYGRVIYIRHNEKYTTIYGHMSAFDKDFGKGSRVERGDVIGYVGSSGRSTGPHVHYEYRVNGVPKNPEKVDLPQAESVPKQYLSDFKAESSQLLARLDNYSSVQLAGNEVSADGG